MLLNTRESSTDGALSHTHHGTPCPPRLHNTCAMFCRVFDLQLSWAPRRPSAVLHETHTRPFLVLLCLLQFLFGWGTVLWINDFPILLSWHSTFLVNSASHLWGRQPYDTGTLPAAAVQYLSAQHVCLAVTCRGGNTGKDNRRMCLWLAIFWPLVGGPCLFLQCLPRPLHTTTMPPALCASNGPCCPHAPGPG